MKYIAFLLVALVWSSQIFANGTSGSGTIAYVYHRSSDGLLGIYMEGGSWQNPDGCENSAQIVLTREDPSRSEFYSAILASKISGREFKAYLGGCIDWNGITYPKIIGVYTY